MPFVPYTLAISDFGKFAGASILRWGKQAMQEGADGLMLREEWTSSHLLAATEVLTGLRLGGMQLIINPATAAEAERLTQLPNLFDGIHLKAGMPMPAVKNRARLLLGRTCHSVAEAKAAEAEGSDYVLLSPIYPTQSHPETPPLGLTKLQEVCEAVPMPVIALGGINRDNASACLDAGAWGVAGIRWFSVTG